MVEHPPLVTREGTSDGFIERTARYPHLRPHCPGALVLDLGAYIGVTARRFVDYGAADVVSVEPDPDNFKLLVQNTRHLRNVRKMKCAVTPGEGSGKASFYRSDGNRYAAGHTLRAKRGYTAITVSTIGVNDLIKRFDPTVMKVDIEHVEAQVILSANLEHVVALAVEYSFGRKEDEVVCREAHDHMLALGFTSQGVFNPGNWSSEITYVRTT